jgi:type II secretory ATPase GspE/PulE/Tfp pilus assembly ATPase PilB-like protein
LRDLVLDRASATVMKRHALTEGMRTLRMDGLSKLRRGLTSAEEVLKETAADNV